MYRNSIKSKLLQKLHRQAATLEVTTNWINSQVISLDYSAHNLPYIAFEGVK